ncbi:lipoprotein signal peptidase [Cellvibrio zantedeschiae]|uniref:Lipoprotein signal peptidase n=1 Tax=Cellvibrio zantedeschiae TaxID=1237077 RepID=A0ABQ3B512_9GAMM|nr:signal peptidase II [Cellvibrio zantedeschiae]GGY80008.1 lipoprotein signal peptidase [Cellvibrio zantedeschiae]
MKKKLLLIGVTSVISIAIDQWTKFLATQHLLGRETLSWWNDFFVLTYSINHGAFLGLGKDLPEGVRDTIFSGLVSVFLIGFTVYALRDKTMNNLQNLACGLVLSGGFSNLYDRITNNGGVVDFMNMGIGGLRTGIFNVADMAIMAGVFLLLIYSYKSDVKK